MEAADGGKPLIAYFTDLARGDCRLGVAGKLMSAADAQACLDAGADFVLIGRGAILHHDFARQAIADAAFQTTPLPVTKDYLREQALGEPFIAYLARSRQGFLA